MTGSFFTLQVANSGYIIQEIKCQVIKKYWPTTKIASHPKMGRLEMCRPAK